MRSRSHTSAVGTKAGSRSGRKKHDLPLFAIGHVVLHVANVKTSARFYERLGLRRVWIRDDMAILELRGGTHLLLFSGSSKQRPAKKAQFDLMADDLDAAHARAKRCGFHPSRISDGAPGGHLYFTLLDPNRVRLTVYSSHTDGRRV